MHMSVSFSFITVPWVFMTYLDKGEFQTEQRYEGVWTYTIPSSLPKDQISGPPALSCPKKTAVGV
jgi:hypothetical protein